MTGPWSFLEQQHPAVHELAEKVSKLSEEQLQVFLGRVSDEIFARAEVETDAGTARNLRLLGALLNDTHAEFINVIAASRLKGRREK